MSKPFASEADLEEKEEILEVLANGVYALTAGGTGAIGSREAPVGTGDGLMWVEATELPDRRVRLECTALIGAGTASLAINVERVEMPLGIFADQDIVVNSPLILDGYDSTEGNYEEQAVGQVLPLDGDITRYEYEDYAEGGYPTEVGATFYRNGDWLLVVEADKRDDGRVVVVEIEENELSEKDLDLIASNEFEFGTVELMDPDAD